MIPVLFYTPGSCAFGSIVALEWLGAPFRLCRLDDISLKSDTYQKLNPISQVPTYKSKDGVLTESMAILQHIGFQGVQKGFAFKQGTPEYDHQNQVLSYLTTSLHPLMGLISHPDRTAEDLAAQADIVQKAKKQTLPARFRHIESLINKQGWLVGNRATMADAYFYGVGRGAKRFINLEKDFPKTSKLLSNLENDAGVRFAQAIEDQEPVKDSHGYKGEVPLTELF